jgi:hypothetical protein
VIANHGRALDRLGRLRSSARWGCPAKRAIASVHRAAGASVHHGGASYVADGGLGGGGGERIADGDLAMTSTAASVSGAAGAAMSIRSQ